MPPNSTPDIGHLDAQSLHARLLEDPATQILDVREPWEHAEGVIAGAVLIPLQQLRTRWRELDAARPVAVICHLGSRSAMAARFLAGQGFQAANVDDGMAG